MTPSHRTKNNNKVNTGKANKRTVETLTEAEIIIITKPIRQRD